MSLELLYESKVIWLVVLIVLILLRYLLMKSGEKITYRKIMPFTATEKKFLVVLDRAVGEEYRVFGKMRIADVILPKKNLDRKHWGKLFGKVSSKHLDYILCDPKSLEILCAIELNDSSHNRADRKKRDVFVEKACRSAQLPLLWVPTQKTYSAKAIREQIEACIKASPTNKRRRMT